jgi:hypothetical protein
MEDTRKQQLISRKSARKSLPFDAPPTPDRYRHEKLRDCAMLPCKSCPRRSDFNFKRDSMASQSSRTTSKLLQEKWMALSLKEKTETSSSDVKNGTKEHARLGIAKAGMYKDLHSGDRDLSGFKRAHVIFYVCSMQHIISPLFSTGV